MEPPDGPVIRFASWRAPGLLARWLLRKHFCPWGCSAPKFAVLFVRRPGWFCHGGSVVLWDTNRAFLFSLREKGGVSWANLRIIVLKLNK